MNGSSLDLLELWVVWPEKIEQFCHFIEGWKPNVWDYDPKEREELIKAVREAIKEAPKVWRN